MKLELLEILRCPSSSQKLSIKVFEEDKQGEIEEGILWTDRNTWYVIHKGVPRMVSEKWFSKNDFASKYFQRFPEHLKENIKDIISGVDNAEHKQTIEVFTNEWSEYQNVGWDIAMEDFLKKTHFGEEKVEGKMVLDVGCGNGRYSYAANQLGGKVIGIDLNGAIDKTYRNVKEYGIQCVQADILNLPFAEGTFDFIFSIGVLHHTQDTENAFKGLVPKLKKNGIISTTYYRKGLFLREHTDNLVRFFSTRVPDKVVWYASYIPSTLAKLFRLIPVMKKDGKWYYMDQAIYTYIIHMRPQHDICYDWWAPKIANRYKKETIFDWYQEMGLQNIKEIYYGPNAVAFKAVR